MSVFSYFKKFFNSNKTSAVSDSEKLKLKMEESQLKRALHLIKGHCDFSEIEGKGLGIGVVARKESRYIALYSGGDNDWFVDMWMIHPNGEEEFFWQDIQADSFLDAVQEAKLWLSEGRSPESL